MNSAIIGVDLGGTNVRIAKVRDGRVENPHTRRISSHARATAVLEEIFEAIDLVVDDEVVGIGFGAPSVVDVERGIVYTVENIPSWREVHLKQKLESRFGLPAHIDNDANAFALGELYFGKGRGYRHLVGLTLGTGLGAGIIIGGRLYSGANCGAGEIGCIPYRRHTIEHYCSGEFFRRETGRAGEEVFHQAQHGDEAARRVFTAFGRELGYAVLVVLHAFDPEIVVLGGSIGRAFPYFEAGLRERLQDFSYRHALERLVITGSETEHAAVLGAAALFLSSSAANGHEAVTP